MYYIYSKCNFLSYFLMDEGAILITNSVLHQFVSVHKWTMMSNGNPYVAIFESSYQFIHSSFLSFGIRIQKIWLITLSRWTNTHKGIMTNKIVFTLYVYFSYNRGNEHPAHTKILYKNI